MKLGDKVFYKGEYVGKVAEIDGNICYPCRNKEESYKLEDETGENKSFIWRFTTQKFQHDKWVSEITGYNSLHDWDSKNEDLEAAPMGNKS